MKVVKRDKTAYSKWVPDNLRTYRKILGLTQAEMGEKLGISPRMYRFYEGGQTKVSLSMEYAMKYLSGESLALQPFNNIVAFNESNIFTKFERERMKRLRNALSDKLKDGEDDIQFDFMLRMCRQAIKEFDNILSK